MSPADEFHEALASLKRQLTHLAEVTAISASPHIMHMTSQLQALPAVTELVRWVQAGAKGPLNLTDREIRAGTYDLSRVATQAKALPVISCITIRDLTGQLLLHLEKRRLLVSMILLRSLIERISLASWVAAQTEAFRETESGDFATLMDSAPPITRAVYGTGLSWPRLAAADLRSLAPKQAAYAEVEGLASISRVQILNAVDGVSKRVAGARLAYDVLCEFLHPNVGDLYSASKEARSFQDAWGTRHIERHLGSEGGMLDGMPDTEMVMAQVLQIAAEIVELYPETLARLRETAEKAERISKVTCHRAMRRQRRLFGPDDLCPCKSGKTVRRCALVL